MGGKHADYLVIAKGNPPTTLEADLRALSPDAFFAPAETLEKGHGRIAHRSWRASTALNAYLDVPSKALSSNVQRRSGKTGQVRQETVVGVTRRPSEKASPKDLVLVLQNVAPRTSPSRYLSGLRLPRLVFV